MKYPFSTISSPAQSRIILANEQSGKDTWEKEGNTILKWTRRLIDLFGDRPAGTERCRKAAECIADDFRAHCDQVEVQKFRCHPWAFIWHGLVVAGLVIVASLLLFTDRLLGATAAYFFAATISVIQFGFYKELLDPLFPVRQCSNVVGILEPKRKPVRQIILTSHHDSAFEFRYLRMSKILHVITLVCYGMSLLVAPLVVGGMGLAQGLFGMHFAREVVIGMSVFTGLSGLIFLGAFSRRSVPGAGDNLVSSGVLVHIGKVLRNRLLKNEDALNETRIILVSFDAEESGLRGSRAFLRDNEKLVHSTPACNINLESLYDLEELSFLVSDMNGMVRLSAAMGRLLVEEAKAEKIDISPMRIHYGLGSTDAAEFAKRGISATTLLAVPHKIFCKKKIIYHSRNDIPENIDAQVIGAVTKIVLRVVDRCIALPLPCIHFAESHLPGSQARKQRWQQRLMPKKK